MENASPSSIGQDQRPQRAGQVAARPDQVQRHGVTCGGSIIMRDDQQERQLAAAEAEPRQGVRHRDAATAA